MFGNSSLLMMEAANSGIAALRRVASWAERAPIGWIFEIPWG